MNEQDDKIYSGQPSWLLNIFCLLAPSLGLIIVLVMGNNPAVEKRFPVLLFDIVILSIEWSWLFALIWAIYQLNCGPRTKKRRQAAIFTLIGLPFMFVALWGIIAAGSP